MLKRLNPAELPQLLERIAAEFDLQIPVRLPDSSRLLQPWQSGELSLLGEPVQQKATAFFFPQTELLVLIAEDGTAEAPAAAKQPLALFGLNRDDLAGIAFLDRFFAAPPADNRYRSRRENALLIGLSGAVGPEGRWLPPARQNCDFELIASDGDYLALACTAAGERWLEPYPAARRSLLGELQKQTQNQGDDKVERLQRAARLLEQNLVPDRFWAEIAERCILCSGCNLVCPTCNCFCVQDRKNGRQVARSRVWDSCQLDAFMREASGHNPLGSEALRTRRRIHHKLVADPQHWGELGCVACGRCDRACPTGIGMFALVDELLKRYGELATVAK